MINLRSATPDDAATMAAVHINAWRTAYRGLVSHSFLAALDHEQRMERFRGFLEIGARDTCIVKHDGGVVCHLTVGPCRDDDIDAKGPGSGSGWSGSGSGVARGQVFSLGVLI